MNFTATKKHIIISGHYGCGKTNIAVALAQRLAKTGQTLLVDIDTVNPYFRAYDAKSELEAAGVTVVASEFANTNLDLPSTPARLGEAFSDKYAHTIFDLGGDGDGAVVMGTLRTRIAEQGYEMLYVFNSYRPETATPEEALSLMRDIERTCGLCCSALAASPNLGGETDRGVIERAVSFGEELKKISGLPLVFTAADERLDMGESYFNIHLSTKQLF